MHIFVTIKNIWYELNYILNEKQRRQSVGLLIMLLLSSVCELLGVSAILPFIQALINPQKLASYPVLKDIFEVLNVSSDIGIVVTVSIGIVLVYIGKDLFLLFTIYFQISFQSKLEKELSVFILNSYMKRPYPFFLNTNSADINRGIGQDVNGVNQMLNVMFKLIGEVLTVAAIGIYMLYVDFVMAVTMMIVALFVVLVMSKFFRNFLKGLGEAQRQYYSAMAKVAYQTIYGIKDIMVLGRSKQFVGLYDKASLDHCNAKIKSEFATSCPEKIVDAVCVGGLIAIVCLRFAMGADPESFIPNLGVFAVAAFRILPSVSRIIGYSNSVLMTIPSLEATYNNVHEVKEYEAKMKNYADKNGQADDIITFEKNLEIKNVCWHYDNAKDVLHDLNLTINKGESIALIGQSGAGKSTLADIILGLLMPQKGQILSDGKDVYTSLNEWKKHIGYIPQMVFLLDDTIRNNVLFGAPFIDDEKIWKALDEAQLGDFVRKLPEGLDTMVGERGVKMSGGQRQRVAIARALYNDPDILVMDEATAALDNETEAAVMESINALSGLKTLLIIAHRLTTVRECDKIYEIGNKVATLRDKKEIFKD